MRDPPLESQHEGKKKIFFSFVEKKVTKDSFQDLKNKAK